MAILNSLVIVVKNEQAYNEIKKEGQDFLVEWHHKCYDKLTYQHFFYTL